MALLTPALQNVQAYIQQVIAEVDALIDTRLSGGLGDLLIKPLNAILEPIVAELIRIDSNQTLLNGPTMSVPDLDALVANIMVTRRPGSKASGNVRLFFSNPATVTVPAGSEFTSADGQSFFSLAVATITANQMSVFKDGDFYYLDVLVQAENTGSAGNLPIGSIVDFVGGPSSMLRVDNVVAFQGGTDQETNTALTARAAQAITVRDLVSKPAITTVLLQKFAFLAGLREVGYGDPEMERDFLIGDNMTLGLFPPVDVLGSTVGIHIGGKVDIYIRVVTLTTETLRIDNIKEITVLRPKDVFDPSVDPPNVQYMVLTKRPIVQILTLQQVDPVTSAPIGNPLTPGLDYTFTVDNPTVRFSTKERGRITLANPGPLAGASFVLTYQHSPETVTVQNFVSDPANRVVTADLLVKYTNPAFVDFNVAYTLGPTATIDNNGMQAKIFDFIDSLDVGQVLEVSDIVSLMYKNGAIYVRLPLTVTVTVSNSDGSISVLTSTDRIQAPSTSAYLPRNIVLTQV